MAHDVYPRVVYTSKQFENNGNRGRNEVAEVKAELDICCTSTNAVEVVNKLKDRGEIIFVPDKYLADYASKKTGHFLIPI